MTNLTALLQRKVTGRGVRVEFGRAPSKVEIWRIQVVCIAPGNAAHFQRHSSLSHLLVKVKGQSKLNSHFDQRYKDGLMRLLLHSLPPPRLLFFVYQYNLCIIALKHGCVALDLPEGRPHSIYLSVRPSS